MSRRGRKNGWCGCRLAWFSSIAFVLAVPHPVNAASITVNTFEDEVNADGDCSLREAISSANRNFSVDACTAGRGSDRIILPAGTYTLRTVDNLGSDGPNGLPSITSTMSIDPHGDSTAVIERASDAPLFRIFHVGRGALALFDVTIKGGDPGPGQEGGGLFNR